MWENCLLKKPDGTNVDGQIVTLQCIPQVFDNIVTFALTLAGAVALVFLIIAGYKFINSSGDPKKVEEARKTGVYAIIGLLLVLFSFAIVKFIAVFTGAECINSFGFDSCQASTTGEESTNALGLPACTDEQYVFDGSERICTCTNGTEDINGVCQIE
jgi:hypothetical protein